jgi:hypothetical protein
MNFWMNFLDESFGDEIQGLNYMWFNCLVLVGIEGWLIDLPTTW